MAKKLGIETDLWALLTANGQLRGGDYKPRIFWTRSQAKLEQQRFPDCEIAAVRVVVQPQKPRAATKGRDAKRAVATVGAQRTK